MENLSNKYEQLSRLCGIVEVLCESGKKSRKRNIVYMRSVLSVYMYKNTELSLREIGMCTGIDHSTVQRNVRLHEEKMGYPDYNKLYNENTFQLKELGFDNPKNYRYKCV